MESLFPIKWSNAKCTPINSEGTAHHPAIPMKLAYIGRVFAGWKNSTAPKVTANMLGKNEIPKGTIVFNPG